MRPSLPDALASVVEDHYEELGYSSTSDFVRQAVRDQIKRELNVESLSELKQQSVALEDDTSE